MFETPEKVIQIIGDTARRFVYESRDLANRHRISKQHLD
jgi:hypothetical protein